MEKCMCCRKVISYIEKKYHQECIKKLFGVTWIPKITINSYDLPAEVRKKAGKMSISGVQIKASAKLNHSARIIEVVDHGATHILKPEPAEYPELPQNENLCMNIAGELGIEVPAHGLFYMADGKLCYIIRRFDRTLDGNKIHVEDMAQLLELPSDSKYESSMEKVGKVILKHVNNIYLEAINFLERVLLCFIIGNGDMHLKNWSLITNENGKIRLAPCYDLVSSKIYIPNEDESALTINGKRNNLKRSDFEAFAKYLNIDLKAAQNVFNKIINAKDKILNMINSEMKPERVKRLEEIILKRYDRIIV
ncbi:MAG: HipA domain-containing protein [Actinobacteria bacterium]|nr:HipA domain-containing protein [Actinomycetota bacterium]MBU4483232.1 HipA domain-containing protein [Actinomycetota bacterium]MCG2791200.1 HipA domain-containing protein [Actinomycetes bacterium]